MSQETKHSLDEQRWSTKEEFDRLLLWLDSDRDAAGRKYERIRYKLIKIFSCRGCCEAEDLADKCVDRVTSKIDWLMQNYEGNPALYFYAVAKKIYLEHIKPKNCRTHLLLILIPMNSSRYVVILKIV